jgi:hypothetical protein
MTDTKRGTARPRAGAGRPAGLAGLAGVPGRAGRAWPEGSTVQEEL